MLARSFLGLIRVLPWNCCNLPWEEHWLHYSMFISLDQWRIAHPSLTSWDLVAVLCIIPAIMNELPQPQLWPYSFPPLCLILPSALTEVHKLWSMIGQESIFWLVLLQTLSHTETINTTTSTKDQSPNIATAHEGMMLKWGTLFSRTEVRHIDFS